MLEYAVNEHTGPIAIRYPRGKSQFLCDNLPVFSPGESHIISSGNDICIFTCGSMTETAVAVSEVLSTKDKSATVVNLRTVYPLNHNLIRDMASRHKILVTLEDGALSGGIGEKISTYISSLGVNTRCINFAYPAIVTHGSCDKLQEHYGLDCKSIAQKILNFSQKD